MTLERLLQCPLMTTVFFIAIWFAGFQFGRNKNVVLGTARGNLRRERGETESQCKFLTSRSMKQSRLSH